MSERAANGLDLGFVESAAGVRQARARRRRRLALAVSVSVTVIWLAYVGVADQFDRVIANWQAALTMVFGSFVAGSTPQGGGAVAFPVFTKVLAVPAEVARSFSLAVQTVGMGAATAAILILRRRVVWRAVWVGLPASLVGFLVAFAVLTDADRPFRPAVIPGPYVKVSFTLVVVAMAFVVYLGSRVRIREVNLDVPIANWKTMSSLVVLAFLGGTAAALTGSGADLFVYLCLAVLLGVDPRIGVPTSVVIMAGVSVVGLAVITLDGQMSVQLSTDANSVVALGGEAVHDAAAPGAPIEPAFGPGPNALPADKTDLFGLWLAAVPVVAWGGPLGSWFASRLSTRQLVVFVGSLAALELVTTVVFVDDLRENPALLVFAVSSAVLLLGSLAWLAEHRNRVLGLPGVALDESLTRPGLDVSPGYRDDLDPDEPTAGSDGPAASEPAGDDETDR